VAGAALPEAPEPGLGWRVNLLDFLMSRYRFSFHQARLFPLGSAVIFMRHVRDVSSGGDSADNPLVRAMVQARQLVRRWYAATHEIEAAIVEADPPKLREGIS
jgi:hypothetical protein